MSLRSFTNKQMCARSPILFCVHSDCGKSKAWLGTNGSPQREDPQQRLRWQAHLEFTHNHTVGDLTWDLIDPVLARSERLHALVLGGIPHSMRPQVRGETGTCFSDLEKKNPHRVTVFFFLSTRQLWMRLSGALQKKRTSEISYREVIKNSSSDDTTVAKQVESCSPHFLFSTG